MLTVVTSAAEGTSVPSQLQLKTTYNSSIRKCSQATVDLFKDVEIIDGTYQGKYFKTEKQIKTQ